MAGPLVDFGLAPVAADAGLAAEAPEDDAFGFLSFDRGGASSPRLMFPFDVDALTG